MREVHEECGITTRCLSILSFWHRHGLTWGKSDLYYVARLELASKDEILKPQEDEISELTWMDVDEFMETQDHPLIRAVLQKVYGVDGLGETSSSPLTPLVEMVQDGVQWPNREPYPTYFGLRSSGDTSK